VKKVSSAKIDGIDLRIGEEISKKMAVLFGELSSVD